MSARPPTAWDCPAREPVDRPRRKAATQPAIGVAEWLNALPGKQTCRGAAFDTVTGRGFFSGSAAKGIEKRLRRHGVDVVARESFLVNAMEGPSADGELARAERWGASLG
nr:hypothetical protein GCM10020092_080110 [Actinoplanes digitatis]